jgi:hypothetical protein
MSDDFGDLEEVAGVSGVQECDVAAAGDATGAGVAEEPGQALAGVDGADEDAFCPGELADGGCWTLPRASWSSP